MESEMVEVEVEFDYEAELSDELTIKAGETIKEVKKMDGGWWEGTLNGRRGVFPDNFVKVINRETPKTKPLTAPPPVNIANEEPVQLRRGQQSRVSATSSSSNKKKQCRVLFSYQPQHEDELELKMEDVVDFVAEVEDGWWKGKLRGRVGVFPSNFVEMIKNHANNEDAEQTVQDKNKRNEKLKSVERTQRPPSSKISNLIHDAESKGKKKSSMENLSLVKRESPLGGEDNSVIAKSDDLSNAPKLPPKPVKEQCIVLFPYNAVNDDELTLEEGQLINIVSKDVEDKGWWKGEIDGKVGVFPDNFVRSITPTTTTTSSTEDAKTKKPSRTTTTGANKIAAPLKTKKIEDSTNSTSSSREKLTGSSEKIFKKNAPTSTPLKKEVAAAKQPVSLPSVNLAENKSSPKKHSFGKSTPPPKPKPPSISKGSTGSLNKEPIKEEPTEKPTRPSPPEKQEKAKNNKETAPAKSESTEKSKELDLDSVLRSDNKLQHLGSERVKAPKRRPPSSDFRKDAKLSGDTFETLEVAPNDDLDDKDTSDNLKHKRSASQGSLHSASNENDSNLLSTSSRQESKNRLSFKMVKTSLKEALGNLNPTNNGEKNPPVSLRRSSEDKSKINSSAPPTSESNNDEQSAKKPDWLAELSRKQANRRSAVFPPASVASVDQQSDTTSTNNLKSGSTSPPKIQNETKPAVAVDKPHIPLKPSQIREEARKSAVFPKRPSNENQGHSNNNVNDKENNKPMVGSKPLKIDTTTTSSTLEKSGKIINQEPPKSPKPKLPNVEDKPKLPVEEKPPEIREIKTPPVIGWKPLQSQSSVTSLSSVNSLTSPVEENKSETKNWKTSNVETKTEKMSLEERVKRLEDAMSSMKINYEAKFETLSKELETERLLRQKLQEDLKKSAHKY